MHPLVFLDEGQSCPTNHGCAGRLLVCHAVLVQPRCYQQRDALLFVSEKSVIFAGHHGQGLLERDWRRTVTHVTHRAHEQMSHDH
jgi:hypothetical protein